MKLSTIQKREKLNEVLVADEKGKGGAYHSYHIYANPQETDARLMADIQF